MNRKIKRIATVGLCALALLFAGSAVQAEEETPATDPVDVVQTEATTMVEPSVTYNTHVQDIGWQDYVAMGEDAGTEGRSLRLEGIHIKLDPGSYKLGIKYQTHIENIGWEDEAGLGMKTSNQFSGTEGRSLRLEGISISLTGADANKFEIRYQTHVENIGWQEWKHNGVVAGTTGRSLRLEAIRIKIVPVGTAGEDPADTPVVNDGSYPVGRTLINNPSYVPWTVHMAYDSAAHYNIFENFGIKHAWAEHQVVEQAANGDQFEIHACDPTRDYLDINQAYKTDVRQNGCIYNYAEWTQGYGNTFYPDGCGNAIYLSVMFWNETQGRYATYDEGNWAGNHVYTDFYYCTVCGATSLGDPNVK